MKRRKRWGESRLYTTDSDSHFILFIDSRFQNRNSSLATCGPFFLTREVRCYLEVRLLQAVIHLCIVFQACMVLLIDIDDHLQLRSRFTKEHLQLNQGHFHLLWMQYYTSFSVYSRSFVNISASNFARHSLLDSSLVMV